MEKLPDTIEEKEFHTLLKSVQGIKTKKATVKDLKISFLLGFYECMRISEVISLQPGDIDLNRGFIHIRMAKGKKDRYIPIMPSLNNTRLVSALPLKLNRRTLQWWTNKLGKEALGKRVHFHLLRASGATHYLNKKKIDIRHIQSLLGHSKLSTTQIYTKVSPEALKNVFDDAW